MMACAIDAITATASIAQKAITQMPTRTCNRTSSTCDFSQ